MKLFTVAGVLTITFSPSGVYDPQRSVCLYPSLFVSWHLLIVTFHHQSNDPNGKKSVLTD